MQKILLTISGGADSTLAVIYAKRRWPDAEFYGIFVDYNQICKEQEYKYAINIARQLEIERLKVIQINYLWDSGGMISGESKENQDVYTPCRNLALLGTIIAYADTIGADIIVTGSKGHSKIPNKNHSFYDSTVPFAKLLEAVWSYTTENKRQVQIIPILAEGQENTMSKEQVYWELVQEGFGKEDTWSCFRGGPTECGQCSNCVEKDRIFHIFRTIET